jgi:hypothetical protein
MQHGATQSYTGVAMQPMTSTVLDVQDSTQMQQWPVSSQVPMGSWGGAPLMTYREEGLPFMQTQGISS